jgi:peptide methionine sulfoxide reductase MsrA
LESQYNVKLHTDIEPSQEWTDAEDYHQVGALSF